MIIFSGFGLSQVLDMFFQKKFLNFITTALIIIFMPFAFNLKLNHINKKQLNEEQILTSRLKEIVDYKENLNYHKVLKGGGKNILSLEPKNLFF